MVLVDGQSCAFPEKMKPKDSTFKPTNFIYTETYFSRDYMKSRHSHVSYHLQ